VIANCSSAHGFGVDAEGGQLLWTVPLKNQHGANVATPIYGSGSIFFVTPYGEEGRRYRLRMDGRNMAAELDWMSPLDTVTGAGVLVDGMLFAAGYRKNKWWMGIDWDTGEIQSQLKEITTGAAVYADGRLYCLDDRGTVGLLDPDHQGLKLRGKFRLVSQRVRDAWAHPVLLDGRLYLRYHDVLTCYDVRDRESASSNADQLMNHHRDHRVHRELVYRRY
jgi:outer membrane protein assembly factor BamB